MFPDRRMEMNGKAPLLSICVPTYNRADKLDRMLSSLIPELSGLEGKVEVCVSDNCSTDNTPHIIRKWLGNKKLPLRARRNGKNMGYEINAVGVFLFSRGDYVWLFCDDDLPFSGAVARLVSDIEIAKKAGLEAIYVNSRNTNDAISNSYDFTGFRIFNVGGNGAPPMNIWFGGGNCLLRTEAQKTLRRKVYIKGGNLLKRGTEPYLMNGFIHTYLFLEAVKSSKRFGIESAPAQQYVGDVEVYTYENRFYLDIIELLNNYEFRRYYSWFPHPPQLPLRSYFIRAAIVSVRPDLRAAFDSSQRLFLTVLRMQGRHSVAAMFSLIEAFRRLPFAGHLFSIGYFLYQHRPGGSRLIKNVVEKNERVKNDLAFVMRRADLITWSATRA